MKRKKRKKPGGPTQVGNSSLASVPADMVYSASTQVKIPLSNDPSSPFNIEEVTRVRFAHEALSLIKCIRNLQGFSANEHALAALYEIAITSVQALNELPEERLKPLAKTKTEWPTLRGLSPHQNKARDEMLSRIGLGVDHGLTLNLATEFKSQDKTQRIVARCLHRVIIQMRAILRSCTDISEAEQKAALNTLMSVEIDPRVRKAKSDFWCHDKELDRFLEELSTAVGTQKKATPADKKEWLDRLPLAGAGPEILWEFAKSILAWVTDERPERDNLKLAGQFMSWSRVQDAEPQERKYALRALIYQQVRQSFESMTSPDIGDGQEKKVGGILPQ